MPDTASLNFTPLTDPFNFFATHTAFNTWMGTITVSINSVNLPAATVGAVGAVKIASSPAYAATVLNLNYIGITTDESGGGTPIQYVTPDVTTMEELKTKFEALSTQVAALRTAMIAAGQLVNS